MLNNQALDIAIGLVFIYALYSLIATTLTELISTWMNLRGRVLRTGLRRMLDDQDSISGTSEALSHLFINRPEFKYLGKRNTVTGKSKLPSYLKPKTFAEALLNVLDTVYASKMDLSIVKDKLNANSPTHQYLITLIKKSEYKTEQFKTIAEEWYNDTMDRVSGWYKKKVQLITLIVGLFIALSMNLNTIEIAKRLGKDEKARLALVEAASDYVSSYRALESIPKDNLKKIEDLSIQLNEVLEESRKTESIIAIEYPWNGDDAPQWWNYLLGCLMTAIALSVGSPFWFDLLNKLIKLRGSGIQEKSSNTDKGKKK